MHPLLWLLLSMLFTIGLFFWLRRFRLEEMFAAEFNFINVVARIAGTIFGLFLAFTIILGWGRFIDARRTVYSEVTSLSLLWRDAAVFPQDLRDRLRQSLIAYTRSVIQDEWPAMAKEQASPLTLQHYEKIWDLYTSYAPETWSQKTFYRKSLDKLNELGANRRLRLLYCQNNFIGPLLAFLFFGSIVVGYLTFCFPVKSVWFHVLLIAVTALIIDGSFYLAYEMQNPFMDYIVVQPDAFQEVLAELGQRP